MKKIFSEQPSWFFSLPAATQESGGQTKLAQICKLRNFQISSSGSGSSSLPKI
jgi:hypothetical protein